MPQAYEKCQFIDTLTNMECDSWYPSEEGQIFCPLHRSESLAVKEVNHIPRTVTVFPENHIQAMNTEVARCLEMSIPDLVEHIKGIEDRIKELERDRRAANIAKRNLEDRLSDEERAALRADTTKYKSGDSVDRKPKKSPEEKAKNRKEGFSAWAVRLGLKSTEELMLMDDDEVAARIAKYKASKQ